MGICCLSMPILVCLKGEIMFIFTSGSDKKKYVFQLQFISNSYLKTCSKEQLVLAQDVYGDVLLLFFQSKTVYFHSKGSLVSNMFSSNTILYLCPLIEDKMLNVYYIRIFINSVW